MTPAPLGPRADVLLAVIVEGIAHGGIPLNSMEDVAALYAWLTVIVPTLAPPPAAHEFPPPARRYPKITQD